MQTEAAFNSNHSPMSKLKSNELGPKMNGFHNDMNNNSNNQASNGSHSDDDLDRMVLHQLEFYFSRENLLHDKYLISQMDSDNYVPIAILIQFNKIKKLFANSSKSSSSDQERILFVQECVKQNPDSKLQLDPTGNKLRGNHKRCVVIIREINKETPVESIMNIFENCQVKCLNCEFAGSRSWYLTFKDEHEAQIAVQFIKEEAQTFNDERLYARIKTNPIPRVNSASTPMSTLANTSTEQDKIETDPEMSKHFGYSVYHPAYYYPPEFPFMANHWMLYPSTPNQFYPNFSKAKQTSIDNHPSSNNLSSAPPVSNYMIDPLMFTYGSYPAYKRKNFNKSKAETDTNSSQNEDNEDNDKRNYYRRYNIGTYNQNFIFLPNPAPFGYPPGPPPHMPYNVGMYPSFAPSAQQPTNQPLSSSSSSTSSKPPSNQADTNPKSGQFKTNRYTGKKYASTQGRPNTYDKDYEAKDKRNNGKYSKPNGKVANGSFKRPARNGPNRKDELAVQFDYEPTSFPPLNDNNNEEKVEVEVEEELVQEPETTNDANSAWSRKSFAEIVKIPTNVLGNELAKIAITED